MFDTHGLAHEPVMIVGRAWTWLRLLDRVRVNDAIGSLLAPLAQGADLDNVVARQNIARLVVITTTGSAPAVMETDAQLLRRYLLSFGRAAAGSRNRLLFDAWTAWPQIWTRRSTDTRCMAGAAISIS